MLLILTLSLPLPASEDNLLPPLVTSAEMQESRHHDSLVRAQGIIRDVFPDELNPQYNFLVLQTETGPTYAATLQASQPLSKLRKLVNARVEVMGICRPSFSQAPSGHQPRQYLGRVLDIKSPNSIRVLASAPTDPFCAPDIIEQHNLYPYQLQQLGLHRASGRVLAVWGGNNVLIETPTRKMMRIEMADVPLPKSGEFIEVVGYPDTDIYRINFTRAIWRPTADWPFEDAATQETTAFEIMTDGHGTPKVNTNLYGKPVRLTGTIQTLPGSANNTGVFQIDNIGYSLLVDVSACPSALEGLSVGSVIQATGLCILNIDNYRPNAVFPQINGCTLVVRRATDITVLSRPSWWTAKRLGWVLAIVLATLAVILIWNRSLSVLAERRGRQLAKEQVERATSELKVLERTRFSAELHDALSQTLSGIAMQLGAIKRFAKTDPAQMLLHLDIASRTLKSCRDEMRNLLWDLRSQVLDEPNIEKALRQILEPHLDEAKALIRFTVPRTRLTDSTARALFCIVRELTVNAIRHGHASIVRIAGSLEKGRLLCSVQDNGCGFNPTTAPGVGEGHFGLQGIRERMDAQNGTVTIESSRDKGTKVTISLAAPNNEEGRT